VMMNTGLILFRVFRGSKGFCFCEMLMYDTDISHEQNTLSPYFHCFVPGNL